MFCKIFIKKKKFISVFITFDLASFSLNYLNFKWNADFVATSLKKKIKKKQIADAGFNFYKYYFIFLGSHTLQMCLPFLASNSLKKIFFYDYINLYEF